MNANGHHYIRKSFDHSQYANMSEYRDALVALNNLAHAIRRLSDERGRLHADDWFRMVGTMARSLPFSDACQICVDDEAVTGTDYLGWPYRATVEGGWLAGHYRCPRGHQWTCGYATLTEMLEMLS